MELLQQSGQIWRSPQQFIRAQGKSVVFGSRGIHTEMNNVEAV